MGGMAEMFDGCLLGKRSLRAEVGNRQRTLHRQAFAHHFAKQPCDGLVRQRTFVQTLNPPQYRDFALGTVHRARSFQFADGVRMACALVQQAQNLGIDFIDGIAVRQKLFVNG